MKIIEELKATEIIVKKELKSLISGRLERRTRKELVFYNRIYIKNGKRKSKGISNNPEMLCQLARKEFLKMECKKIDEVFSAMKNVKKKNYVSKKIDPIKAVLEKFPEIKISYFFGVLDDNNWDGTQKSQNSSHPEYMTVKSDKGVMMRSKSEVIIASRLDAYKLPYIYEKKLNLKQDKIFSPDFTLINPISGEEVYWEHFGMTDNPEYMKNVMKKIQTYISNGITPEKNLIITFESSNGLDIGKINSIIESKFFQWA